jgi:hypothetical protein
MRREHKEGLAWALFKLGMVGWLVLMFVGLTGCAPEPATNKAYVLAVHRDCVVHYTKQSGADRIDWIKCGQSPDQIQKHLKKSCGARCATFTTTL